MSSHQAGLLKQSNKKHKGTAGKRDQKRSLGSGRVSKPIKSGAKSGNVEHKNSSQSVYLLCYLSNIYCLNLIMCHNQSRNARNNRRNQANQLRSIKKTNIMLQKRLGITHIVNKF